MIIGERLKELRQQKKLTHGDIEKRSGLLRGYISRLEHGHTVPSIPTLEKLARALDVPLYRLFHQGEKPPQLSEVWKHSDTVAKNAEMLKDFRKVLSRVNEKDRQLLLVMARTMARAKRDEARKKEEKGKSHRH